jgi:hypothetical protein
MSQSEESTALASPFDSIAEAIRAVEGFNKTTRPHGLLTMPLYVEERSIIR